MKLTRWHGLRLARPAVKVWRSPWLHHLHQRNDQFSSISWSKFSLAALSRKLFAWGRRRLTHRPSGSDSVTVPLLEEDGKQEQSPPPPKGHLVVYVADRKDGGQSGEVVSRRYVVPVVYMNHPLFGELLTEAVEEFGYDQPGGIMIPCPVARFERVKDRIAAGAGGRSPGETRFGVKRHLDR